MFRYPETQYYGDQTRWFVADVIDATPPYGLEGRVRIRIHGVHSPSTADIKQADLPWAQVVLPTTEGGVSGIGSTPHLQPGATVFGFFLDGSSSQVPLVLGSIPKVEFPSRVQQQAEFLTAVERYTQEEVFYQESIEYIDTSDPKIQDSNEGGISADVVAAREAEAIKFFLSNGYTINQAIGIVGGLTHISSMVSGEFNAVTSEVGLAGWKNNERVRRLKQFKGDFWKRFSTQLAFIVYELNSTQTQANVKLLNTDSLEEGKDNCASVFAKHYLRIKSQSEINFVVSEARRLYSNLVG